MSMNGPDQEFKNAAIQNDVATMKRYQPSKETALSALMLAFAKINDNVDAIEYILTQHLGPSDLIPNHFSYIFNATKRGQLKILQMLLSRNGEIALSIDQIGCAFCQAFTLETSILTDIAKCFIDKFPEKIAAYLPTLIKNNKLTIAKILLDESKLIPYFSITILDKVQAELRAKHPNDEIETFIAICQNLKAALTVSSSSDSTILGSPLESLATHVEETALALSALTIRTSEEEPEVQRDTIFYEINTSYSRDSSSNSPTDYYIFLCNAIQDKNTEAIKLLLRKSTLRSLSTTQIEEILSLACQNSAWSVIIALGEIYEERITAFIDIFVDKKQYDLANILIKKLASYLSSAFLNSILDKLDQQLLATIAKTRSFKNLYRNCRRLSINLMIDFLDKSIQEEKTEKTEKTKIAIDQITALVANHQTLTIHQLCVLFNISCKSQIPQLIALFRKKDIVDLLDIATLIEFDCFNAISHLLNTSQLKSYILTMALSKLNQKKSSCEKNDLPLILNLISLIELKLSSLPSQHSGSMPSSSHLPTRNFQPQDSDTHVEDYEGYIAIGNDPSSDTNSLIAELMAKGKTQEDAICIANILSMDSKNMPSQETYPTYTPAHTQQRTTQVAKLSVSVYNNSSPQDMDDSFYVLLCGAITENDEVFFSQLLFDPKIHQLSHEQIFRVIKYYIKGNLEMLSNFTVVLMDKIPATLPTFIIYKEYSLAISLLRQFSEHFTLSILDAAIKELDKQRSSASHDSSFQTLYKKCLQVRDDLFNSIVSQPVDLNTTNLRKSL